MTKVSVIIPTFNREATVLDAVHSALEQSYSCMEVIVVDDGSSDGTRKLLDTWSSKIKVLHQPNSGPSAARNHGARHASGEILAFLDSDDVWMPDKIERQVSLMEEYGKEMICCVCNALIFNGLKNKNSDAFSIAAIETERVEAVWKNPGEVLASRFLLFNQVAAIRREPFIRVGGYNPRLRLLEDHELALRLAALDGVWGIISMPLVKKRNDTRGIGVVCCENSLKHSNAQRVALSSALESGWIRDARMRQQLKQRLRLNMFQIRNEAKLTSSGWFNIAKGYIGIFVKRVGDFVMRHFMPKASNEVLSLSKRKLV